MSKFVAGVIGWGLSIVWTAVVFVGGVAFCHLATENIENAKDANGGLHEV